jgi:hypothetical protein
MLQSTAEVTKKIGTHLMLSESNLLFHKLILALYISGCWSNSQAAILNKYEAFLWQPK